MPAKPWRAYDAKALARSFYIGLGWALLGLSWMGARLRPWRGADGPGNLLPVTIMSGLGPYIKMLINVPPPTKHLLSNNHFVIVENNDKLLSSYLILISSSDKAIVKLCIVFPLYAVIEAPKHGQLTLIQQV